MWSIVAQNAISHSLTQRPSTGQLLHLAQLGLKLCNLFKAVLEDVDNGEAVETEGSITLFESD